jgi:anti-sigma B factor antagonist
MSGFQVTTQIRNGRAILRCAGELDLSASAEAEAALREVEASGAGRLVLDLRSLVFMDSTGLRVVLAADSRARRDGRELVIVKGPETVHRVFRIALLDRRLEFVDAIDDDGPDGGDDA